MATAGGVQQDGRSLGSAGHHESITAPRPTVPAPSSAAPVMVVQHPPAPRDQGRHGSIHAGRSGHTELAEPDTAASKHTLVRVFGDSVRLVAEQSSSCSTGRLHVARIEEAKAMVLPSIPEAPALPALLLWFGLLQLNSTQYSSGSRIVVAERSASVRIQMRVPSLRV
jgi:hypothetical protein